MTLNKKNKFLLAGFVIMLMVCYRFAFRQTLSYRSTYLKQTAVIQENSQKSQLLPLLKKKDIELTQQIRAYSAIDTLSFQNELLKTISTKAMQNSLKIKAFNEPHIMMDKGIKITSYDFVLEGGFNPTLALINDIENIGTLGVVKHISFQKKMNYKNNTFYLLTEVILQRNESGKAN